jgi:hypothetical protein
MGSDLNKGLQLATNVYPGESVELLVVCERRFVGK